MIVSMREIPYIMLVGGAAGWILLAHLDCSVEAAKAVANGI